MLEELSRMMSAGLGALSMTRERAEKLFDECVQRGQAEREQRSKFVQDVMDAADKARNDLERIVSEQVHRATESMKLASRDDLARLETKLDALATQLEHLHQHQHGQPQD